MATKVWTGGNATDAKWSRSDNWSPSGAPVAGDDIQFAGTTRLTTNNDIAADTSFASITFNAAAGLFVLTGNRITLAGNIVNNSSNLQTVNIDMIFNATRAISTVGGNTYAIGGIISGAGGVTKNGAGDATLSALNTYTGKTTITQGRLLINTIKNVSGGSSSLGAPTSVANGTIDLGARFAGVLDYIGSDNSTTDRVINITGAATYTAYMEQNGSGNVEFTSNFTYASGAKTLHLRGTGSGNGKISGAISDTSSGAMTLEKSESGTWTLSGTNTYTGKTSIFAGTLSISTIANVSGGSSNVGAPTTVANGTIAIGSTTSTGTLLYTGTGSTTNRVVDLAGTTYGAILDQSGSGDLIFSSNLTATGAGIKTLTLQGSTASIGEIDGLIVDNSGTNKTSFVKLGTGSWKLKGENTFTGTVTVSAGKIICAVGGSYGIFGKCGNIIIDANAEINLTDYNALNGYSVSVTQTITVRGTLSSTGAVANNLIAVILDGGTISADTKETNYGTFNFDYGLSTPGTGVTGTISGGNSAACRDIDGTKIEFNIGAGDIVNCSTPFEECTIRISTGLKKLGTGTLVLSGTSNFASSNVEDNAGTLRLTGSFSASTTTVTVGSGAILAGNGTIAGAITVSNGGKIAPDTSGSTVIGTLNTAAVTFNATSTYSVDLDGVTPTFDKISSSGTVALGSAANTLTVASITNSTNGKVYTIIGSISLTGTFNGKAEGSTFVVSGRTLKISYAGNNCTLTDVTPEGSSLVGDSILVGDSVLISTDSMPLVN